MEAAKNEADEIAAEVHHNFIGRQAAPAGQVADGASAAADVIDEQATDTVKYWWLGPSGKLLGFGVKAKQLAAAGAVVFKTTKEAADAARKLGFRRISETIRGQAIFTDGKRFITRDIDSHKGGAWKMADSVENLGSRETRTGTFDATLERIGD
ncbi:MAG: hypothetical protein IPG63_08100 [Xanthomonadales bacterium]|nr:hypothetical protein [Xanthomonadales bacterium]